MLLTNSPLVALHTFEQVHRFSFFLNKEIFIQTWCWRLNMTIHIVTVVYILL